MRLTALLPVLAFLAGTVQHFLWRPLGAPALLAPLLPVSESPREHYKLAFYPLCAALLAQALRCGASWRSWALAALCACAHAFCTMFGIFCFYVCALGRGRPLLAADIGSYGLTMGCGWSLGLRVLARPVSPAVGAGALAALLAALFFIGRWSFFPPRLPLFRELPRR